LSKVKQFKIAPKDIFITVTFYAMQYMKLKINCKGRELSKRRKPLKNLLSFIEDGAEMRNKFNLETWHKEPGFQKKFR